MTHATCSLAASLSAVAILGSCAFTKEQVPTCEGVSEEDSDGLCHITLERCETNGYVELVCFAEEAGEDTPPFKCMCTIARYPPLSSGEFPESEFETGRDPCDLERDELDDLLVSRCPEPGDPEAEGDRS